ncbi:MAG: WYL domain-containing protein [Nitrospirota bacterium]|nr:WYL domain-containing protein [Nitrospirota bacterium]
MSGRPPGKKGDAVEAGLRIIRLHQTLCSHRHPVPRRVIEERLECSRATAMRVLSTLRGITGDPIPWHAEAGGYAYESPALRTGDIPYLWFGQDELLALLAIRHYLEQLGPGLLGPALAPLAERTRELLRLNGASVPDVARRVRLVPVATRSGKVTRFPACVEGCLTQRRMGITYQARGSGQTTGREVSPQFLVHYRDNWYLIAFCHLRSALRSFAVECITAAKVQDTAAHEVDMAELDAFLAAGYGIFAGPVRETAVLRFSAERARWVADERWHPEQRGHLLPDGSYELSVPYADATELLMDILRHGPEVEVLAPPALRAAAEKALREALQRYVVAIVSPNSH